jgi:L-amino acid N-acyltransferase YncA
VSNGVVVAAALRQFVQALRHRAARAAIGTREQRALYQTLLADLAGREFHAALAGIALPNPGSIRLHEQVGFAPLGVDREVGFKVGRWHDLGWWQRLL